MHIQAVSSLKSFVVRNKKRILEVGIGRSLYFAYNFFFDDIAWPLMIVWLGWKGGLIMSAISLVQCLITLVVYQRMGKDWLGWGIVEEAKKYGHEHIEKFWNWRGRGITIPFVLISKVFLALPVLIWKVVLWTLNKGPVFTFFGLGMVQDPFEVTAYFMKADFSKKHLTKRDWLIFLASWLWTNIYWNFRSAITALMLIFGWKIVT